MSFCWFCHEAAQMHMICFKTDTCTWYEIFEISLHKIMRFLNPWICIRMVLYSHTLPLVISRYSSSSSVYQRRTAIGTRTFLHLCHYTIHQLHCHHGVWWTSMYGGSVDCTCSQLQCHRHETEIGPYPMTIFSVPLWTRNLHKLFPIENAL